MRASSLRIGLFALALGTPASAAVAAARHLVLVNSRAEPRLLKSILRRPDFPTGADVFTHELSLNGKPWAATLGRPGLRARLTGMARRLEDRIEPYRGLAAEKSLRVWLGHPLLEDGKLYNAYSLVDGNGIAFTQRKKFLWKTERWLFSEPAAWEGRFEDCALLLCSEISAFFDINRFDRPSLIPELRADPPSLVVVPAYWTRHKGYLLDEARALAGPLWRKRYEWTSRSRPVDVVKGVRPEGVTVLVINHNEAAIVSPVAPALSEPRPKTELRARLRRPGWIELRGGRLRVIEL